MPQTLIESDRNWEVVSTPCHTFATNTDHPADTLTMSLPESEDTEEADEPEDRSWGLGRDKVRRWL